MRFTLDSTVSCLNRTIIGLKDESSAAGWYAKMGLNRTIIGLKVISSCMVSDDSQSLNRTIIGLKELSGAIYPRW